MSTLDVDRYQRRKLEKWTGKKLTQGDYMLSDDLDERITNEAKNFVFEIVNISKDDDPYQADPNHSNNFQRQALLKDKKFIGLLKEIKKDFERGCKNYL